MFISSYQSAIRLELTYCKVCVVRITSGKQPLWWCLTRTLLNAWNIKKKGRFLVLYTTWQGRQDYSALRLSCTGAHTLRVPAFFRPPLAGSRTRFLAGSHLFALAAKKARFRRLILAGAAGLLCTPFELHRRSRISCAGVLSSAFRW